MFFLLVKIWIVIFIRCSNLRWFKQVFTIYVSEYEKKKQQIWIWTMPFIKPWRLELYLHGCVILMSYWIHKQPFGNHSRKRTLWYVRELKTQTLALWLVWPSALDLTQDQDYKAENRNVQKKQRGCIEYTKCRQNVWLPKIYFTVQGPIGVQRLTSIAQAALHR